MQFQTLKIMEILKKKTKSLMLLNPLVWATLMIIIKHKVGLSNLAEELGKTKW